MSTTADAQQAINNAVAQIVTLQQLSSKIKLAVSAIPVSGLNPGGDLQNQIDGLTMQLIGMAKTLQLPANQTIGMLPAWCVRVMAKIPPGTVF